VHLAGGSRNHDRIDLAENDIDAAGDARHYGASCNGNKPGHQSVLDEILTTAIFPDSKPADVLNKL
jgi:hypothetical protein